MTSDPPDQLFADSPLRQLSLRLSADDDALTEFTMRAAARANSNLGENTYLHIQDAQEQARQLPRRFPDPSRRPLLYGIPVSIKDCFDLAGTVTTCGSRYYAETNPPAAKDSWVAQRLREAGAVVMGKTNMQELAYGITGENPWFGDCRQPDDAVLLTGGSSSGAAASVQESSALAAIGTDTGGSIRVPAALCGLVGYRASLGVGDWRGGWHLAPSFDTVGWLFRDLRDGLLLASALFGTVVGQHAPTMATVRIGFPTQTFLADCDSVIAASFEGWRQTLTSQGYSLQEFATDGWDQAFTIFAAIQASEAAALQRGHYDAFEPAIRDRLKWGASLPEATVADFRIQHNGFRSRMDELLVRFNYLLLPSTPVSRLLAGADQSQARPRILRYTVPISLGGFPVATLPGGMQLVAPRGSDTQLLSFASSVIQP